MHLLGTPTYMRRVPTKKTKKCDYTTEYCQTRDLTGADYTIISMVTIHALNGHRLVNQTTPVQSIRGSSNLSKLHIRGSKVNESLIKTNYLSTLRR